MRAKDCALILLASGQSQRFGSENKLLADLNGKPLIQHVIDNFAPFKFSACYAVVSNDDVADVLAPLGFNIIRNKSPESGHGHALSLGAGALKKSGRHMACIGLADMPFVSADHIKNLLGLADNAETVMSIHKNIHMPPAMFKGAAFERLLSAFGDKGAKRFAGTDSIETCLLDTRGAMDIDTPADLAAARLLV